MFLKNDSIFNTLEEIILSNDKILFMGVGEVTAGDDGFGPYIVTHFIENGFKNEKIKFINVGGVPDEREKDITDFKPDVIIVLDVCESNNEPGTLIFTEEANMVNYIPISSHAMPIQMFMMLVHEKLPGIKVYLLGVEPFKILYQAEREFYKPDFYTLDDYDKNPDLPFYAFNMTVDMIKLSENLIKRLKGIIDLKK